MKKSYMIQMTLKKVIFISFLLLITGCDKEKNKSTKDNEDLFNEYFERYMLASYYDADDNLILSAIDYIDSLLEKGKDKIITSIYYDKAQLLYKLGRYDEALNTLYQSSDSFYNVYIATLLICLNREDEAVPLLENQIIINKNGLIELQSQTPEYKRKSIIQGTMMFYILIGRSREEILFEMTKENIISMQEAELLLQDMLIQDDIMLTKENILISMWPKREIM